MVESGRVRHQGQLLSVVYHSAADPGLSSLDVDEILATSRIWNRHRGITGLLLSENGRFLQALEGPEPEVRALMDRIQQDPRITTCASCWRSPRTFAGSRTGRWRD